VDTTGGVSKCVISQKLWFPLFVVMKTSNVKAYMPNISSEQNNNLKSHDLDAIFVSPSWARNRRFPKASLVLHNLKWWNVLEYEIRLPSYWSNEDARSNDTFRWTLSETRRTAVHVHNISVSWGSGEALAAFRLEPCHCKQVSLGNTLAALLSGQSDISVFVQAYIKLSVRTRIY
jgi:hypothetical protein